MADANHSLDIADKQQDVESPRVPGRPFVAGQSGNPSGRPPRGQAFTDIMRELMELPVSQLREKARHINDLPAKEATALRQILDGLMGGAAARLAVAGRVRAYTYNRLDGDPHKSVDVNDPRAEQALGFLESMAQALTTDASDDQPAT